jgi:hypothetical protein
MASNAVFRWLDGRGWLVLAGDAADSDEIRSQALAISAADGAVAVLLTQSSDALAENLLNDIEGLGAPAGYLVDLLTEDDDSIRNQLAEAGMIVVGLESDPLVLRSGLFGAAIEGIRIAFEHGAVVLAEGAAAMVFGAWVLAADGAVQEGLGWLESALILPGTAQVSESAAARQVLAARSAAIAVGIGAGSALALGPDGEIETWGLSEVSVALGPDFAV